MMIIIELTLTINAVCRAGAIWTNSGAFNEINEVVSKKEKLLPMTSFI
jgi:hypothetical protein